MYLLDLLRKCDGVGDFTVVAVSSENMSHVLE